MDLQKDAITIEVSSIGSVDTLAESSTPFTLQREVDLTITTKEQLQVVLSRRPLPEAKHGEQTISILSFCSTYRILFVIIFLANLAILIALLIPETTFDLDLTIEDVCTATAANLFVTIASRNDHVINFLFLTAIYISRFTPLSIRLYAAKVYNYGGVHSGCAIASIVWYTLLVGLLTQTTLNNPTVLSVTTSTIAYLILFLFIIISITAHPQLRRTTHNTFELIHRFLGWLSILLFWTLLLLSSHLPNATPIHKTPTLYLLSTTTFLVLYPWLHLRLVPITSTILSPHAMRLSFPSSTPRRPCEGLRLSLNPLIETHAFALIPAADNQNGFSILVSNAGDWTAALIANPPSKIWVRGLPVLGMLHVCLSFKRVVLVATGSGIGPCLGVFSSRPDADVRVVWSARDPLGTYGADIVGEVRRADPGALVLDSARGGRVDLTAVAWAVYKLSGAEAVCVMSNARVTGEVVKGLRAIGVPALGPVFDS